DDRRWSLVSADIGGRADDAWETRPALVGGQTRGVRTIIEGLADGPKRVRLRGTAVVRQRLQVGIHADVGSGERIAVNGRHAGRGADHTGIHFDSATAEDLGAICRGVAVDDRTLDGERSTAAEVDAAAFRAARVRRDGAVLNRNRAADKIE